MSTPKSCIELGKKRGNISDFSEMWISTRRTEHDAVRLRAHPYEFFLYYDV